MRTLWFLTLSLLAVCSSPLATVDGSFSSDNFQDSPSPPRNLRYSVVGAWCNEREYRVSWSASSFTGDLPVNYSIKLCVNDSYAESNGACKWSSNPDCRPTNILSTDRDFFCVLENADLVCPCNKYCNYTISAVAENAVGSAISWQYEAFIPSYSATPWPPLSFNVVTTDEKKELRVSWTAKNHMYLETEYTILYHAENEMENKTKVIRNKTGFTLLTSLEAFMEYYVYLMLRFVSKEGKKSAPSEVQGPRIVKTPAGEPDTPSKVIRDWSAIFPGNPALRNVTVEWELVNNASWRGTPGKYVVLCNYYRLTLGSFRNCEYYVDATSNIAVLQRLNSNKSYLVYIKLCNREKMCSGDGEPYIIKAFQGNTTSAKNGGKQSSSDMVVYIALPVGACILGLLFIYVIRTMCKQAQIFHTVNLRDRISLQAPAPSDYDYVDPLVTTDYDQLSLNESEI